MKTNFTKKLSIGLGIILIAFVGMSLTKSSPQNEINNNKETALSLSMQTHSLNVFEGKCGDAKTKKSKSTKKAADKTSKCGEGKCGEGKAKDTKKAKNSKCGEGKCGEGKSKEKKEAKKEAKKSDAKCGAGKCGKA